MSRPTLRGTQRELRLWRRRVSTALTIEVTQTPIPGPMEIGLSLMSILFGVVLLNPVYNTFESGNVFRWMAFIAPEWAWGVVALTIGLLKLLGIMMSSRKLRMIGAMGSILFWAMVSAAYFMGTPGGIGWTAYAFIMFLSVVSYIRVGALLEGDDDVEY